MVSYRYSYWDGTQNPFDLDEDDVLEALSEDIMNHGDVNRAMRNLMRQGMSGDQGQKITGIRELRERLSRLQQQQMERYNLESAMDDIAERLEDIISTERSGIERRLDDARQQLESGGDDSDLNDILGNAMDVLEQRAQQNTEKLDLLPESPAGQIRSLSDYDFMDPEAQEKFPGTDGDAAPTDDAELLPRDEGRDSEYVARRYARHTGDDTGPEPDAQGQGDGR